MRFIGLQQAARALLTAMVLGSGGGAVLAADANSVLTNYADIALAGYQDSLTTAQALDAAVDNLIANPSDATLNAARAAWIAARVPYQQTEVYRFGTRSSTTGRVA